MSMADTFELASSILVSIGSGGVIVASLSAWLGKVWAEKLMAKESAAHNNQLEELRAKLQKQNDLALSEFRTQLEVAKAKHLAGHEDKIKIYRLVVDIVSDLIGALDQHQRSGLNPDQAEQALDQFNRERMKAYGYLAMLAPQEVMDAADALIDDLHQVAYGSLPYDWKRVRSHILRLISLVRVDIGFDKTPIEYRGTL